METIFDHNVTDKELERFGGREAFDFFASNGINLFDNEDTNNYQIGLLYAGRNDKEKAEIYFSRVKDKSLLSTLMQDF